MNRPNSACSITGQFLAIVWLLIASLAYPAEKLNFNVDWRFVKANPACAEAVKFDDNQWQRISVPHTYNDIDTFDDWSPLGHKGEINQWGGKTWYRKHFNIPADWKNKTVIIEFEAVRQVAEVYCNGVQVAKCENGFVPFGADLSKHLKFGQENILAVACDNSFVKDTDGDRKKVWHHYFGGAKFPWNNPHWHPAHGGIYRNVYLHVSDKLHLTQSLYNNMKTVGTYAYAINPSRVSTGIGIEAEIENAADTAQTFTVRNRLIDRNEKTVLELTKEASLEAGERTIIKNTGTLKNPHLWEPKYPYLYKVITEIVQNDTIIDVNKIPFGVRWVELSTRTGFSINGRYLKLQGWGMKSVDGWPGLGAATPDWMHYYTLKLITDCGGNFVRWGHTAGGPIHLRAADELGIVTQQPGVDGEGDTEGHAWDVRLASWRDVVIYFRNNPSLLVWEGGNQSTSKEHTELLKKVVTTYDPHGGRVYGHRRANNVVKPYCDLTISTEGSGYIKSLPTIEGEYNREESPRRIWDRSTPPYENWHANGSYDLTAEDFAINQLFQYQKIAPLHHGGANWIFVDSTSGGRVDTEVTRTSGELDSMRLPKEAYHVCRVIFTDEPDIHLIGHWNYPSGTVKNINVVGDCDEVSLQLNGKEIGRKRAASQVVGGPIPGPAAKPAKDTGAHKAAPVRERRHPMLFTFPSVAWKPGTLAAVGYTDGKEIGYHELKTAGPAAALRLTPVTGPTGLLADGSDAVVFDVEAVDKDGNRDPLFIGRCDFETSGPGIWRGGYNSGKAKSINKTCLDLEAGINRVIIRSTRQPGTITLTAKAEGLKPTTATIDSQPVLVEGGIASSLPRIPTQGELTLLPLLKKRLPAETFTSQAEKMSSELLEDISYSGLSGEVRVRKIEKGEKLFTDNDKKLSEIPAFLKPGEFIQLPNLDWNYSAVDLLQFNVKKDATIYIAHDIRIEEKMDWLQSSFTDTGKKLSSGKHHWQLYKKKVRAGESVLLGSNTESQAPKRWMMMVFVVPDQ